MVVEFFYSIPDFTTVSEDVGGKGKSAEIFDKPWVLHYIEQYVLFMIPRIIFITLVLTIQS